MPRIVGSIAVLVALAGCGGLRNGPAVPVPQEPPAAGGIGEFLSSHEVRDCVAQTDAQVQLICRNRLLDAGMIVIAHDFAVFEARFHDSTRYGSFGTTLAGLGLTTAASVSGGAAARSLAAAAAGVLGLREAFGRDVLGDQAVSALQSAMNGRRAEIRLRIEAARRQDVARYSVGAAVSDLIALHRAGTIAGAVQALHESAAQGANAARVEVNRTAGLELVTPQLTTAGAGTNVPAKTASPPPMVLPRAGPATPLMLRLRACLSTQGGMTEAQVRVARTAFDASIRRLRDQDLVVPPNATTATAGFAGGPEWDRFRQRLLNDPELAAACPVPAQPGPVAQSPRTEERQ